MPFRFRHLAAPLALLLALPVAAAPPVAATEAPPPGSFAVSARLEEFLGDPLFVPKQQLWEQRGGWGGVIAAPDGTFVAFQSPGGPRCKRSLDGGRTWGPDIEIGPDATGGNAIVDESTGDLLYVNPDPGWLYRSRDSGATWSREAIEVKPDGFGNVPRLEGVAAMQCGITLAFGPKRGRLIMPARVMGPKNSNAVEWRPYHYSTAIFSDDGGKVWRTSHPFPVLGTGEAALAELSDGTILYNSREHMSRGNRFLARSEDGGSLWIGALRSAELPDGPRGSSYGLMGGMVRLPVAGHDVLLFSNADTAGGAMPAKVGDSSATARERVTVWASFDGGRTWPVKRLVEEGPSAYSSLGVGRTGTPSAGRIAIIFEGGPRGAHAAVQVATFNLAWLLDGRDVADFLPPANAPPGRAEEGPSGDAVIRGPAGGSEIVITTTSRLAGAIHSLTWNGREFIDSHDHGRQLQSASNLDLEGSFHNETFNPTEAGSRADGAGPTSTSRLLWLSAAGRDLVTVNRMAFWLRPGETSGDHPAVNTTALSNHLLEKEVRIGAEGIDNAIRYAVTFTVPAGERHRRGTFEALTGYMPPDFRTFHALRDDGGLEPLSEGPGEQPLPVIVSTADGGHAMGTWSPDRARTTGRPAAYGRFWFEPDRVSKWNCVFRERAADGATLEPGTYRYLVWVALGTRGQVADTLARLRAKAVSAASN